MSNPKDRSAALGTAILENRNRIEALDTRLGKRIAALERAVKGDYDFEGLLQQSRETMRQLEGIQDQLSDMSRKAAGLDNLPGLRHDLGEVSNNVMAVRCDLASHLIEHYGDPSEDPPKPPTWRTANTNTLAQWYPVRYFFLVLGFAGLCIYEVRAWIVAKAAALWKLGAKA